MRLAVLDTNVIVSAAIRPGSPPAKLVMDWVLEGQVQAVTCPSVVEEYREVVQREKFRRYGFPPLWLEFVSEESLQLAEPSAWKNPLPDVADAPFLALAKISGAWLVTGDLRHFPRSARGGVTVLSPADYVGHLLGSS
jgi:uncharacterized protein